MRIIAFLSKAIFAIVSLPFVIAWQLLRFVGILLWRLPELFVPRLRHNRQITRFRKRAEVVRERAKTRRVALSQAKAKRNATDLADEVLRKLRGRQRDIAPNVFERARLGIRDCGERADVDGLDSCFKLLTESAGANLNARLMAWHETF